eukprot:TRINITY_DN16_c0_g1_i11.p1 TRINITY_DN16_c0_g1~~TRINITY_DN16_c0_g1_i11.p1  ORF type:complete len:115 (-),score=17.56 TRINITY_DN16_c0_g1_i11:547-891(-)
MSHPRSRRDAVSRIQPQRDKTRVLEVDGIRNHIRHDRATGLAEGDVVRLIRRGQRRQRRVVLERDRVGRIGDHDRVGLQATLECRRVAVRNRQRLQRIDWSSKPDRPPRSRVNR